MLKIDSREFVFEKKERGLNRNAIKVGDFVGFSREGEEIIGCVERLIPRKLKEVLQAWNMFTNRTVGSCYYCHEFPIS